jgi:hypothetical protein
MSEIKTNSIATIAIVTVLILSFFAGRNSKTCDITTDVRIERDTVIVLKESEPIIITQHTPRLVYIKDTLIVTKPFEAIVDTVVKRDTVYARYSFPANTFDLWIKRPPDSVQIHTIYITRDIIRPRPWYETPLYVLGGGAIGFGIGKVTK